MRFQRLLTNHAFKIQARRHRPAYSLHSVMTCQKCRAPLKLDQSLESLNPASFDLLIGLHLQLMY